MLTKIATRFRTGMSRSARPRRSTSLAVVLAASTSVGAVVLWPQDARACSFQQPAPHTLDAGEQRQDTVPPSAPQISGFALTRGQSPKEDGCGRSSASSCDDLGTITFQVTATDDRTPTTELGYQLSLVRGKPPANLAALFQDAQPIRALADGALLFVWLDGAVSPQDDLDFEIEVRTVDLAGNVSVTATTVPVRDVNTACGIGRRGASPPSGLITTALVLLGIAARRRRRTTRH